MGGSASFRLARKIANALAAGAPRSEIEDLERQRLTLEREKRAMMRNANKNSGPITKFLKPDDFKWDRNYQGTEGRNYGKSNTSDALDEIRRGAEKGLRYSLNDYLDENGIMLTGWQKLKWSGGEDWFYFTKDGDMVTGDQTIDGKKYHFDNNGVWIKG